VSVPAPDGAARVEEIGRMPGLTVSVVIPAYNSSRTLAEALTSVHAQSYLVHEIIVVDDGSKPEEAAAIDAVAGGCVLIHLPKNRGPSVARNRGIARATGEWVAFLDSDDLWLPEKLEKQMAYVGGHPDCRAVHSSMKVIGRNGSEHIAEKTAVRFEDLVNFPCPIFPSTVVMHRESLLDAGLFDPTKRCCEDLDLFLRFTFEHPIHCIAEPLIVRRASWEGLSANIPCFWREADRVYREYQYVFPDEGRARNTLTDLHGDFMIRALYARDFGLLWRMGARAVRHDVPLVRVLPRVVASLVRNYLHKTRKPKGDSRRPSDADSRGRCRLSSSRFA
jgi:glycosyltransferase involved in cell wall biosynthesis